MSELPDEPPSYVPDAWTEVVRTVSGRYYHVALDMAAMLAVLFGVMGAYGVYAGVDGSAQLLLAAAGVVAVFAVIAIREERRWRA